MGRSRSKSGADLLRVLRVGGSTMVPAEAYTMRAYRCALQYAGRAVKAPAYFDCWNVCRYVEYLESMGGVRRADQVDSDLSLVRSNL